MSSSVSSSRPNLIRRRVINPLLAQLRQGLSPTQLALTVSLGAAFGLVPMLGITSVLGTAVAVWLRLNVAAMLLISHLLSPVQLLLLLPLLRHGASLLGGPSSNQITLARVQHLISNDWVAALQLFWRAEVGALLLWFVGSIPVVLVLYAILLPIFRRVVQRQLKAEA